MFFLLKAQELIEPNAAPAVTVQENDVGNFVDRKFDSKLRSHLIQNCWTPGKNFPFPLDQQRRKFQFEWLQKWPWLRYSHKLNGVFCIPCMLFLQDGGGVGKGSHVGAKTLVSTAFNNWKVKLYFRK